MNKLLIFFMAAVLAGCASMSSIDKNYSIVDKSDGVNVKEAVVIAQKHCLDNPECKGDVRISTPDVSDHGTEWSVAFWSKNVFALDHAYVVMVDKKTGNVAEAKFAL